MMKVIKLLIVALLLVGCEKNTSTNIVNDKLVNGYSYPVEGGLSSTSVVDESNVITFYNVKTNNLFSICSGKVEMISADKIEIKCDTKEYVTYSELAYVYLTEGSNVAAGEKIADLSETTRGTRRYRASIVFKVKNNTLTNTDFFSYIKKDEE